MAWPNQPVTGHVVKTEWNFDTLSGSGWVDAYSGSSLMSLVDNQNGPESPPSALQAYFPTGHPGGNGAGNFNYVYSPGTREMYVGMWVKHESPFQQHPDGDKVCYYGAQGGNQHPAYSLLLGSTMTIVVQADGTVDNRHLHGTNGSFFPFTGTGRLGGSVSNWTMGSWHRFEVFLRESSTKTSRDGVVKWWVDNTLVGNYTNVNTAQLGGYTGPIINPVYGGGTQVTKTQDDYVWYDHVIATGGDSGGSGGGGGGGSQTGLLQGSRATPTAGAVFNLTSEGITDWVHWGAGSATTVNGKSGGTSISRTATSINGGAITFFTGYPCTYTWSNGTPTATQSGTQSGINIQGPNQGLRITVPADTTERTLKVWGNCFQCSSRITASLSDASANNYIDLTSLSNTDQWTFVYRAGSANQSLTFTIEVLSVTASNGNVSLQAAALTTTGATIPAPTITSFSPSSGLVGSSVTITGTNFDALASNNTVKFNGTTAAINNATTTQIIATVPSGATTGTISVTTPGGTATSGSAFTVDSPPVPGTPGVTGAGGNAFLLLVMP